jgi:uncharacterized protein YhdP
LKNTDMSAFTDGRAPDVEADDATARTNTRNTIAFGMDMENFMRSDVGRYLDACSRREIVEFLDELSRVTPTDAEEIRRIQMEIASRRMWADWLSTAIQAGHAAQEVSLERGSI